MGRPVIHDDAARGRLLDVATDAVQRHGVEALSVRGVARAAGMSTGAVYALFGGRGGLVAAVYSRAVDRFAASLARAPETGDPIEDLVALAIAFRDSALADPHGFRVIFGGVVAQDDLPREALERGAATFTPLLARVERAQVEGRLSSSVEAPTLATALWANVLGLTSIALSRLVPPAAGDPVATYEPAVRAVLRGWAPTPGNW